MTAVSFEGKPFFPFPIFLLPSLYGPKNSGKVAKKEKATAECLRPDPTLVPCFGRREEERRKKCREKTYRVLKASQYKLQLIH